jgi:uncharacterized protein DUF6526
MAEREQSFKRHARFLPAYHFFVIPILLINVLNAGRHAFQLPTLHNAWEVVLAVALLTLGLLSRTMTLTVQDRVIRLEERLRLRQLLPADLQSHIDGLTYRQLIALRFASDAEVVSLVREIAAGKLTTQKDIKTQVKNWRADWLRA